MTAQPPTFDGLLRATQRSALHLETRDGYSTSHHAYRSWRAGEHVDPHAVWPQWRELLAPLAQRGAVVQRARIVSEPLSDYIRFEHAITADLNLAAGEDVRWLPRRHASDIALPGNDFWVFDNHTVLWVHFTGDGESAGHEVSEDPALVKLCGDAFQAVWERAVPHADYRPN